MSISIAAAPMASLSLVTGRNQGLIAVSMVGKDRSSYPLLHVSSSLSFSSSSSFYGLSLGIEFGCRKDGKERHQGFQVRAGKAALCLTKRSRSRKSLARTHGFRRRMRTTSGRSVLKRRRVKGRKVLCTKSNSNSGKRA